MIIVIAECGVVIDGAVIDGIDIPAGDTFF